MRLIADMGDRKVYWDFPDPTLFANLLQGLIHLIGPATGDLDEQYAPKGE